MSEAKSILINKLSQLTIDSRDAVLSRAWTYPLLGISYFTSHPNLYKAVTPTLLKALSTSVGITLGLFFFTYLPQMAFCALFSGIFAPIAAGVMVLGEAYVLIWFIGKPMMMIRVQDKLFDQVMVMQGHENLVAKGREITQHNNNMRVLGKDINIKPGLVDGLSREGLLRYLISLPLNTIPGIGTAMFLIYNGEKQGPGYHARYFALKGWDKRVREEFVHQRKAAYTAFGAVGLVLNMVPFLSLVFGLTTTVGAALWASELEKKREGLQGNGPHVERVGQDSRY